METAFGHSRLRTALFAALFLILSVLQPGLFAAANAAGFHPADMMALSTISTNDTGHGADHAKHAAKSESQGTEHHHKAQDPDSKSCEIHCAPVLAVPVDCPVLARPSARCFPPVVATRLPLDEYAEFIQPPRSLI